MAVKCRLNFEILTMGFVFLLQCQFSLSQQDKGWSFEPRRFYNEKFNCHETIRNEKLSAECWCIHKNVLLQTFDDVTYTWFLESAERVEDMLNRTKINENVLQLRIMKIRIQAGVTSPRMSDFKYCSFPIIFGYFSVTLQELDMSILFNADYPSVFVYFNVTCLESRNAIRKDANFSEMDVSECKWSGDLTTIFTENIGLCSPTLEFPFSWNKFYDMNFIKHFVNHLDFNILSGCDTNFSEFIVKPDQSAILSRVVLKKLSDKKVRVLGINLIGLVEFDEEEIPAMDSLEVLDLSDNNILRIHRDAFKRLTNVRVLKLKNTWQNSRIVISHLPNSLRFLDLRDNKGITYPSSFSYSVKLSDTLPLSDMPPKHYTKLETLLLSNCSLESFSPTELKCRFPSLKHLDLSYNKLDTVDDAFFADMTKLESLDLSFNRLIHITYNDILVRLPNLEHCNLGHNGIGELLPLTITKTSVLRELDLSSNQIRSWNKPLVKSFNKTLTLNLSRNNIDEVNSWMIQDFDQLDAIYLVYNTFDCNSCSLEKFLAWLNSKKTTTDILKVPYLCHSPAKLFGKNITDVTPINCEVDLLLNLLLPVALLLGVGVSCAITYRRYRERIRFCTYVTRRMIRNHRIEQEDASTVYRHDAFVSYCSADEEWVGLTMVPAVENEDPKLHLSLHGRDFIPGVMITDNIIASIEQSRRSVFIITPRFIASNWCQWEIEMAKHRLFDTNRGKLILIILEEINIQKAPRLLREMMKTKTYLIWPKNKNGRRLFWRRFKDALGECRCVQGRQKVEESSV